MLTKVKKVLRRGLYVAALVASFCFAQASRAENDPRLYAVEVTAAVQTAPAQVQLSWPTDVNATGYSISRRLPTATAWTSLTSLAGSATGYTDGNVTLGGAYEYRIVKSSTLGMTA